MPFNRFLLTQLNERLGQFIGMMEHERLLGPEAQPALPLLGSRDPDEPDRQAGRLCAEAHQPASTRLAATLSAAAMR